METAEPGLFDIGMLCVDDINETCPDGAVVVLIPVPSIGVTNHYVDICSDLLDASFVAERLAAVASAVDYRRDYETASQRTLVRLQFDSVQPGFMSALRDAILLFGQEDIDGEFEANIQALRDAIQDFEIKLDHLTFRVPDLIDWYYANLVGGAYYSIRSEAPGYYRAQIALYPERLVGFFQSGHTRTLGSPVYASSDIWVIPANVDLDVFLMQTGQRYRKAGLLSGQMVILDGQAWALSDGMALTISMDVWFRGKICASLARARAVGEVDVLGEDHFSWSHGPASRPAEDSSTRLLVQPLKAGPEHCQIDSSGTLVVLSDGQFRHLFFDSRRLNQPEADSLAAQLGISGSGLASEVSLECDWANLDDEGFERLCYDLIRAHPRFDADTVRKFGKSRSRDGGRDIEAREIRRPGSLTAARKWIFQCKLLSARQSLTGARLVDIGDMLDRYNAQGFGVLTSGLIDATLYDKLDAVCGRRGVEQLNMSVLEIERALAREQAIKARYFP